MGANAINRPPTWRVRAVPEQLGFLAHELRNLVNVSILAFEVLKTGNVGIGGSTGAVLHRSLIALRALVDRSLASVRLTEGVQNHVSIVVSECIEEVGAAAALEAAAKGQRLTVVAAEPGVGVMADRQVLVAVLGNLLQNALKFTPAHGAVTLRVRASPRGCSSSRQ